MSVLRHIRKCWPSSTRKTRRERQQSEFDGNALSSKPVSLISSDETLGENGISKFLYAIDNTKGLPDSHAQLQLHTVGQDFVIVPDVPLPILKHDDELLIQVNSIGLNPIDWKAPAFGWGLPSLPCVLGRDFIGTVVKSSSKVKDREIQVGSIVGCISTDYRDYRKAAFQEYAIAPSYNVFRVPSRYEAVQKELASLGVAFVTAALAFGVCLGGKIPSSTGEEMDLLQTARSIPKNNLSKDIYEECVNVVVKDFDRIQAGDWILIWGAGSSVGFVLVQLAKLAGLKVICVADAVTNGSALVDVGVDVIVHRKDPQEAAKVISGVTKGKQLRFGIDTVGKESTGIVTSLLHGSKSKHIVGLVGLPNGDVDICQHRVPIKLFHEVPTIGKALMNLLEDLLQNGRLVLPKVHLDDDHGLQGVNFGLQLLRSGNFDAQRIVVPIK